MKTLFGLMFIMIIVFLSGCQSSVKKNIDINTRIVIDQASTESFCEVTRKLHLAAVYYQKINLRFVVNETIKSDKMLTLFDCLTDARLNQSFFNVYVLPYSGFVMGYGFFPTDNACGIVIFGDHTPQIYGHEIGHSLGYLIHPFDNEGDDFVDDTGNEESVHTFNLMGYSVKNWELLYLTDGQLKRFSEQLKLYRSNIILK
jgi:hypothetical protein